MHPAMEASACSSIQGLLDDEDVSRDGSQARFFEFAFEKELETSPAYKRAAFNKLRLSNTSSNVTPGPSFLSGLSLSDVSNVTAMALPISASELWNHHRYKPESDAAKIKTSTLEAWYDPPAKVMLI